MSEVKFNVSQNLAVVEQALMWATALSLQEDNIPSKRVLKTQARMVKEMLAQVVLNLSDLKKAVEESQKQPEEHNEQLSVSDGE